MASASASLHEDNLKPLTVDQHRALVSIQEELEAVDWYNQRAEGATDDELRAILEHNRDEEKEHAMMALEWLRRRDPKLNEHMRTYLFTRGSVLKIEAAATGGGEGGGESGGGSAPSSDRSLGIGSLRGTGSLIVGEFDMSHLHRHLAPISSEAWDEIEEEARRTLKATLAARKLVDFAGPKGWQKAAVSTGRVKALDAGPRAGVTAAQRQVLPLIELRAVFELSREELDGVDRGSKNPDLDPVIAAARNIALSEDSAIFHGYAAANIKGICEEAPGGAIPITRNYEDYPVAVAQALTRLRNAGVDGPYAIALGPQCYTGLTDATKGGYPIIQHVRRLIDGPIVYAPAVDGAVVLSMRGGDFKLTVGEDFSIGYLDHTAATVQLYLEESFTFQVLSPQAAVRLAYSSKK